MKLPAELQQVVREGRALRSVPPGCKVPRDEGRSIIDAVVLWFILGMAAIVLILDFMGAL